MAQLKYIDNHTHGAYGINFNYCNYDDLKSLLKELYKKNIVGICATLVGDTNELIEKQLELFKQVKIEQENNKNLDETYIIGVHLEGSFISPKKAGIQDESVFLKPNIANFKKLVGNHEDIVKIVTIAPEENIDLIDYLNSKNILTQAGHTIGDNLNNCRGTTHHFNAMNPIHHRNNSIALEGLINNNIYCEIIADLIHNSKKILELFKRIKPIEKILLVSDSLPSAHFNDEIIFCNKKINSSGKDENGTLAGSNQTLDEICINLLIENIFNEIEINQVAFLNQIKYLNLKNSEIDILNRLKIC